MTQAARPDPHVSLIVTTYNWPDALEICLRSLAHQSFQSFEVVIADNGSTDETRERIEALRGDLPYPVEHVWQDDQGFRAAEIRNKAVLHSRGDYLIFLDGDCFTLPHFVRGHVEQSEPGRLTVGRRSFLYQSFSREILQAGYQPKWRNRAYMFFKVLLGGGNRAVQLLPIPVSERARKSQPLELDKAQTCNLGVWRDDYVSVYGFDESYNEYGLEDTDLVCRLYRRGVRRTTLNHLDPVLHLWHPRKKGSERMRALLEEIKASDATAPRTSCLYDGRA